MIRNEYYNVEWVPDDTDTERSRNGDKTTQQSS